MKITATEIRDYRKSLNRTQAEFANLAGVSQETVRMTWEVKGISEQRIKTSRFIAAMADEVKGGA